MGNRWMYLGLGSLALVCMVTLDAEKVQDKLSLFPHGRSGALMVGSIFLPKALILCVIVQRFVLSSSATECFLNFS